MLPVAFKKYDFPRSEKSWGQIFFLVCLFFDLEDFVLHSGSIWTIGLPKWYSGKGSAAMEETRVPGLGRCPGGGDGNPLQYSCLENPRDRGILWASRPSTEHTQHMAYVIWSYLFQIASWNLLHVVIKSSPIMLSTAVF